MNEVLTCRDATHLIIILCRQGFKSFYMENLFCFHERYFDKMPPPNVRVELPCGHPCPSVGQVSWLVGRSVCLLKLHFHATIIALVFVFVLGSHY